MKSIDETVRDDAMDTYHRNNETHCFNCFHIIPWAEEKIAVQTKDGTLCYACKDIDWVIKKYDLQVIPTPISLREILQAANDIEDDICAHGGELSTEIERRLIDVKSTLMTKSDKYRGVLDLLTHKAEWYRNESRHFQKSAKSMETAVEKLREAITFAMKDFGIEEIEGASTKISLVETPGKVIIDDVTLLPSGYTKVTIDTDLAKIKADLLAGIPISGASLEKEDTIRITRKKGRQ